MIHIRVLDAVGPICVDPEDGTVLCVLMHNALSQGQDVNLDFAGVRTLTSSFLNSAVGCLRATLPAEAIEGKLSWAGLDAEDEELIRLVLKNANRFYSASHEERDSLTSASLRGMED
ncbi:MAG: STAS-like domain-containing protein [Isosphaerales bacterium]